MRRTVNPPIQTPLRIGCPPRRVAIIWIGVNTIFLGAHRVKRHELAAPEPA